MNYMKRILTVLVILLGIKSYAQQDPMYTQYMYNTMAINPAYAGSKDALSILGLYRAQWVGLDGAPNTQTLSAHMPVGGHDMGLGITFLNDKIGATNQTQLFLNYSYPINLSWTSKLRFGLSFGMSVFQSHAADLNNRVPTDQSIFNYTGKIFPNVGLGLFYYGEKGYLGLSIPKLFKNFVKGPNELEVGRVRQHFFLMGGYVYYIDDFTKFKPSFMLKMVSGAPISLDLSANVYFNDHLGLGLAWRNQDAISGIVQYYFSSGLNLSYSYDFITSPLRHFNGGSHEFMIGYDIGTIGKRRIYSPRFF